MARDSGGTWSAPAGNPVVDGTAGTAAWANTTVNDLGAEISDSLSRSGKGGMTAALRVANGTAVTPSYSFTNDTGMGLYRSGSGEISGAGGGVAVWKWTSAGFWANLIQSLTLFTLRLVGRAPTTGSAVGIILDTEATYVAGDKILSVRSNTSEKASIAYDGAITTASTISGTTITGTTALVASASQSTTGTAGSNWSISGESIRRSAGVVSVDITMTATGAGAATIYTIPTGYRPGSNVYFFARLTDNSSGLIYPVVLYVQTNGTVVIDTYDNGTSLVVTGTAPLSNIAISDSIIASVTYTI